MNQLGLSSLQPQCFGGQLLNCLTASSPCHSSRLSGRQHIICPIPKVSAPLSHSDYPPISIRPILFRIMEKLVVPHFLYPTYTLPPSTLNFSDQFAFRPTGSTTAALIYLSHTVIQLLTTHRYVIVTASYLVRHLTPSVREHFLRTWRILLCQTKFITG